MPAQPHILENDFLRVEIFPEYGGRITSLRSVRTGEEFILPSLREPGGDLANAVFSDCHLGGFDECLPSVSSCDAFAPEAAVPDHGDLWRKPWSIESDKDGLLIQVDAVSRPLRLRRLATLQGDTLTLSYEIENISQSLVTWLWCAHPLLQAAYGDHIVLSPETTQVHVEYASDDHFPQRAVIPWPLARSDSGEPLDLSLPQERSGGIAYKVFAESTSGRAILYRSRIEQGIEFCFDPSDLPFLGIWVNAGAWPEGSPDRRLTIALEPTTSNYDSLAEAELHGAANRLAGGARQTWTIALKLLGAKSPCQMGDWDL